jgi:GTP-binding protein
MFYDRAKIYVRSGNGGDGMISFRREKHVPLGGPDGGDGGKGGDIVFVANSHLSSLVRYHKRNHFRAGHAGHGNTRNRTGASGDDVCLEVPVGTVMRNVETGQMLVDMTEPEQRAVILVGGRGGRGNAHFVSSVRQAPRLAQRGEPGMELWLDLELKLMADVGIIGVPNAGKSTLISAVSAARPKIADYPFTTLQPNLGVVVLDDYESFVMADIPGLIEGAAEGVGLGHDFLRHVERTRVLVHLIDGAASDPLEDWAMINQELAMYGGRLHETPQLVVLSKMDLPDAIAWEPIIEEEIVSAGYVFCSISAVTGRGVQDMLYLVKQMLDETTATISGVEELVVISPTQEDATFTIEREGGGWRVKGQQIERIAAMTYFEFDATLVHFQRILEKMGITEALSSAGLQPGDTVYIGEQELEWGAE